MSEDTVPVGVVGAGITGLALAHELSDRDVHHVVYEATDQPGGVIRSGTAGGVVVERGPQRTRLTAGVERLVDDLGLRDAVIEGDPTAPMFVYADGDLRTVPFSIPKFLTTDLLSWRGKARLLAEPLTKPGREDESAATLFSRKFGHEAYENLIGPLFGGIYGSDPAEMPAGYAPSPLLALERRSGSLLKPAVKRALANERSPPITFVGGMQELPEALYDAHADAVALSTPVEGVRHDGEDFVLQTDDGDTRVERVVFTTPADVTADLVENFAPPAAASLRTLNYNPLALVYLRAPVTRRGFGYQVRRGEGLDTLGVSWNGSLFDRDGLYTVFLGGMDDPELVDADDGTLGEIATREFREVVGHEADVLGIARLRRGFPAWDWSWEGLESVELPPGAHIATNYTARMGIPGRIREARELATTFADSLAATPVAAE